MELITILAWLVVTMIIGAAACLLGKKQGIEYLVAMFVGSIAIANIIANKIVQVGPFETSAGIVVFSITFLLSDTVAEFWGRKKAQQMVLSGFLMYVMLVFVTQITLQMPGAAWWTGQEAYETVIGNSWRVAAASALAYIFGQTHDVWAYHYWKRRTKGKHLWLRNNASTWTSQTIDTLIFTTVAFYGLIPISNIIIGTLVLKITIAALDTPLLYFIRWYYTKRKPEWKQEKGAVPTVPGV